jgi:hypothetical protein
MVTDEDVHKTLYGAPTTYRSTQILAIRHQPLAFQIYQVGRIDVSRVHEDSTTIRIDNMLRHARPITSRIARPTLSAAPVIRARTIFISRPLLNQQISDGNQDASVSKQEEQGHPKISAVPFHFGQEDANSRLKIAALLATGKPPILLLRTCALISFLHV